MRPGPPGVGPDGCENMLPAEAEARASPPGVCPALTPRCLGGEHAECGPQLTRLCPTQSLMLAKAKECWEQENVEREAEKTRYLAERIPSLQTRGLSLSALQVSLEGRAGLEGSLGCPGEQVPEPELARPQAL